MGSFVCSFVGSLECALISRCLLNLSSETSSGVLESLECRTFVWDECPEYGPFV